MQKFFSLTTKRKKGFSAIELGIVVGLIVILAGSMVPIFLESRVSAKYAKAKTDLEAIASAAKSYYSDHYTMAGLTLTMLNQNGYLSAIPKDPWGEDYVLMSAYKDDDGDEKPDIGSKVVAVSAGQNGTLEAVDTDTGTLTGTLGDDAMVIIINVE